jgi:hypothetical protein
MNRRQLIVLVLILATAGVVAAVMYWPTPRRAALARVHALQGTLVEQWDSEAEPHLVNVLMLTNRPVMEEDLAALRDLRPLHRLLLDGSPVTDAGLAHLGQIHELELLNLSGSKVTDAGLVHLAGLKKLKMLSLRRTRLTNDGLAHLRGLTDLQSLNLIETAVTERGAAELKRALPKLRQVHLRMEDD